jgi:hypothetical protein
MEYPIQEEDSHPAMKLKTALYDFGWIGKSTNNTAFLRRCVNLVGNAHKVEIKCCNRLLPVVPWVPSQYECRRVANLV